MEMEKKCNKCEQIKDINQFRKSGSRYRNACKDCTKLQDIERNKKKKQRTANLIVVPFDFECSEQEGLDCKCCGKFYPLHCFKKDTRFKRGYSKKCITCLGDVTQDIQKICLKCGEEKYLHQFRKDNIAIDGRQSTCCECDAEKERELHKIPEVREKNKNKCLTYRQHHLDYDIRRCQDYKDEHEEELKEYARKYLEENKDIIKERNQRPEAIKRRRNNKKRRLKEDPQYYLREKISTNVRTNLKVHSVTGKAQSCEKYGIDIKAIFDFIGPKPYDNYTLDHIVPCKAFDLNIPEHIKLCYSKENLRWCLDVENYSKNDFIIPDLIRKHNLIWLPDFLGINLEQHEKHNRRLDKYNKQEDQIL